ncbi:MAG: M48 family metalloprotease, partial [Candidatus Riflebacteria bacterium]|nr:M48 family metalloprotease [Candidatus Riflebacteria bacterium]
KMCENDDELAGVVAHEMGHVDNKHSVRQAEKAGMMTILVAGLGLNKKTQKAAPFAAIAAYFANLKFSRNDEFEADAAAVKYTNAAGYNPNGLISFFNKINKDTAASKVTKYFSTHPPTTDRINAVKKLIAKLPAKTTGSSQTQIVTTTSTSSPSATSNSQTQNTAATSGKPTTRDLQLAYESYLYYQQLYQYKVQEQAPMSEVMDAFNKYQAAKKRYMELRKASGL